MKKKINLYWYKHPQGAGNFGDVQDRLVAIISIF